MTIRAEAKTLHPLTQAQKRIWYVEKIHQGKAMYNIGGQARIYGPVDFGLLEKAVHHFMKTNEGLCLQFVDGDVPMQYVSYEESKLDFFDFSTHDDPQARYLQWVDEQKNRPFALAEQPLFYFALFTLGENDNGLFINFHHLIADGWSIKLLSEEIRTSYLALLAGKELPNDNVYSYLDYVEQENGYLNSNRFLKDRTFWHKKFSTLPDAQLIESSEEMAGNRKSFVVEEGELLPIQEFVRRHGITTNTFFTSIFLLYLYKTTGHKDLVIGVPVFNRTGRKERNTFGMFTSTMPFRIEIEEHATFVELVAKISQELKSSFMHQKYPYNLLVQELELRKKGYDQLFQYCVNYYNTKMANDYDGIPVENGEFYNGNQLYSLQFVIREWSDVNQLTLDFDYKVHDFSNEQIDRMYADVIQLIHRLIQHPDQKICTLSLLTPQEQQELLIDFNANEQPYPQDKTVVQLFEEQVERTPEHIAVCFGDLELSYQELNRKANQLARTLACKGVGPETMVGILATPSPELVIAILAVLKSGGAYVPIDPEYPAERVRYMLEDSEATLLLTNKAVAEELASAREVVDIRDRDAYHEDASNPPCPSEPYHLAYMIYTSGTTGHPKGVMIEHRGLVNYICWAAGRYLRGTDEVFALFTSFAFDLTVTSIFTPLITGNRIAVYSDQEDEYVLYRIVRDNKATVVKLTPSHLSLLTDMDLKQSSIRRFIVGGEDLKVHVASQIHDCFGGQVEICNEYGPTEAVVGCMIHAFDVHQDQDVSVPIGIPIANMKIFILDHNLNPVPVGRRGELYISSEGLARGYRNMPELTRERFVDNPFQPNTKLYKTGDLASFLAGGVIAYHGRIDDQVKIRGYRIELQEIENALLAIDDVKQAVVVDRKDASGQVQLVAYHVSNREFSDSEIRNALSESLPHYMIPVHYVSLDHLPLTVNGKVDRRLLPAPVSRSEADNVGSHTENERILTSIIESVLQIQSVGVNENFYNLGGDSIKAIQVAAKLQELGYKIQVKTILKHPILADMVACMQIDDKAHAISQEPCRGLVSNTPIVSWFLSQNFAEPNHWNQSVLLEIRQEDIDSERLGLWVDQLVAQQDSLRLNYDAAVQQLFYNDAHVTKGNQIESIDLSALPADGQDAELRDQGERIKASFDIQTDLLFKACLFDLGARGKRLLLTAHHLVVDGVSWRIILEHLAEFLQGKDTAHEKTHSYQYWAQALNEAIADKFAQEVQYWRNVTSANFSYPVDFATENSVPDECKTVTQTLDSESTSLILKEANRAYHTQPHELLVMSLAMTLNEQTKKKDIILELESHGREEIVDSLNLSRTAGWFTSLYPIRMAIDQNERSALIKSLKEQLKQIPNQGIGYGMLKHIARSLEEEDKKRIRFNFLGDFDNNFHSEAFAPAAEESGAESSSRNHLTSLLDFNAMIVDRKLKIMVTFNKRQFREETVVTLLNRYVEQLQSVIAHCCTKEGIEFTPSDFDTIDLSQGELDALF